MKLPMPTPQEIYNIADRTSSQITSNKHTNTLLIENAVRNALQIVVDRLNIQVGTISVDLSKS